MPQDANQMQALRDRVAKGGDEGTHGQLPAGLSHLFPMQGIRQTLGPGGSLPYVP